MCCFHISIVVGQIGDHLNYFLYCWIMYNNASHCIICKILKGKIAIIVGIIYWHFSKISPIFAPEMQQSRSIKSHKITNYTTNCS